MYISPTIQDGGGEGLKTTGGASEGPTLTDVGGEDTKVTDGESKGSKLTTQGGTPISSAISRQAELSLIVVLFALVVAVTSFKT